MRGPFWALRRALSGSLLGIVALLSLTPACGGQASERATASLRPLTFPSTAGLNYGEPRTADGEWAGTRWLRPGYWERVHGSFDRDLALIQARQLGSVLRLFIGLDELMVFDGVRGYRGFDARGLHNFSSALDALDAHHLKALVVLYDQEEVSSPGNFHFAALDGGHPAMRAGYVKAVQDFMTRFGSRPTVLAWDLFNEAYMSLGDEGDLPRPPAADPVSPGYPLPVVRAFLSDLYQAAKRAAPAAWLTVSDANDLYWHRPPRVALYDGVVDFYDIHVYDDRPAYPDWPSLLGKPYIVGEAGASVTGGHFEDQQLDPPVLSYLLQHSTAAGVRLVLAQGKALTPAGELTPIGKVVSDFVSGRPVPS